jgi:hypothetical protein
MELTRFKMFGVETIWEVIVKNLIKSMDYET